MALTLGAFIPPIVGLLSALFNRSLTFLRFNVFFLLSSTFLACTKKIDNSKFQFVDLIIDTLIIGSLSICLVFFCTQVLFLFSLLMSMWPSHTNTHALVHALDGIYVRRFIQFHFSTAIGNKCLHAIIWLFMNVSYTKAHDSQAHQRTHTHVVGNNVCCSRLMSSAHHILHNYWID